VSLSCFICGADACAISRPKTPSPDQLPGTHGRIPPLVRDRFPRTQADLASWNVNLSQRKVALHSDFMNEFSEF
jgi:hypothetical protein